MAFCSQLVSPVGQTSDFMSMPSSNIIRTVAAKCPVAQAQAVSSLQLIHQNCSQFQACRAKQEAVADAVSTFSLGSHSSPSFSSSPFNEYDSERGRHRDFGKFATRSPFKDLSWHILSDIDVASRPLHSKTQIVMEEAQPCGRVCEDDDISLHLPELREVLAMLKEKKERELNERGRENVESKPGNVFLVGTGPGDSELLTLKAFRLLQRADLVLYDRLVATDILDMIRPEARLLYVGKTSGYHSRTQEEIHELLLAFAEAGATVVRLKGGDPLIFGRGGEEVEFLQEKGIRVDIVPGITAASGIAAELGVPLTHRGVANSVRFLTGHSRKGGEDPLYVAQSAADPDSTLVIYMGLATLPGLAQKFLANGLSPSTPAVAVERGTTPGQRTVFATLQDLPKAVDNARLVSPTLIIVGCVVALSPLWPYRSTTDESAVSLSVRRISKDSREPRDRALRGSDPELPSQING